MVRRNRNKLAAEVLPLLKKHHYLLVTLLLCNACAMEALPIFLDAIVPAVWAILISVTAVLFFGEIIPQAVCTGPQQLKIASWVAPSVSFLMIAVGIVAYPISRLLDCLLGEHHPIRYTNNDLKALIELHSYKALQEALDHPAAVGLGLQGFQTKMIQGAIDIQNSKVQDIMISFKEVFSISINKKITYKSAKKIAKFGYSRIPVFINKDKHAIIGYLLIKTLVGVDLSDERTIRELITKNVVKIRKPIYVSPTEGIGGLLSRFKNGKSHMAIVTDNVKKMERSMKNYFNQDEDDERTAKANQGASNQSNKSSVLGIITLEDIIESAIKEDILDEADYDNENDVNADFRLNSSMEAQSAAGDFHHEKLHDVIQQKIEEKLARARKQSDFFGKNGSSTQNFDWLEMNDISENLLKKDKNYNEKPISDKVTMLKNANKEFSKSYSLMQGRKKI